jgi:hypothetical protein
LTSNKDKALIIGASNITLDLNSYTISGPGGNIFNFGVFLQGKSGVTIKNGTIRDIGVGILIQSNADGNTIDNMTLLETVSTGVIIEHTSHNNTVQNSMFLDGVRGALLIWNNSTSTVVRNNEFIRNAETSENGVLMIGGFATDASDNALVENNLFQDNRALTLFIDTCVYRTVITGNTFFDDPLIPNPGDGTDQIHCEDNGIGTIFLDNVASPVQPCPPPDGFIPGHACASRDSDYDGVLDDEDICPGTSPGLIVNEVGCSGGQLIDLMCDAENFPNHGLYVTCVAHWANEAAWVGLITVQEKEGFITQAANSDH